MAYAPSEERVGPYRLCLHLATGGMATVYLACQDLAEGIRRFVALKRIHPSLMNDPTFAELFLDEARIALQIQHANVCSAFDFGVANGTYYLTMELLQGESLARVRRALLRRPLSFDSERRALLVARIVADAAEGLQAAHELRDASGRPLDVVHRDVSPDNVFLTYDGVVKLVDFGIARASHQRHKTRTGMLKGKFSYIQPEVLQGAKPDRRADIWGLGVILWELLTLRRLFRGKTDLESLRAVLEQRIPAPSRLRPGLPPELDDIVLRALSRDPNHRYGTARELAADLSQFLATRQAVVGLGELSGLMGELFPDGRARMRQLLEIARTSEPAVAHEPLEPTETTPSSCSTWVRSEPPPRPAWYRSRRVGLSLAAGAVVALSLITATRWLRLRAPAESAHFQARPPRAAPGALDLVPVVDASNGDTTIPIRLGTGPYVLEIAPGEDTSSPSALLRIRQGRPSATEASLHEAVLGPKSVEPASEARMLTTAEPANP